MDKKYYVAQYAAIFDKNNRMLLLRDCTSKQTRGNWILPGGHIASDKDATARQLLAAGVPAPEGLLLSPGEPLPVRR